MTIFSGLLWRSTNPFRLSQMPHRSDDVEKTSKLRFAAPSCCIDGRRNAVFLVFQKLLRNIPSVRWRERVGITWDLCPPRVKSNGNKVKGERLVFMSHSRRSKICCETLLLLLKASKESLKTKYTRYTLAVLQEQDFGMALTLRHAAFELCSHHTRIKLSLANC